MNAQMSADENITYFIGEQWGFTEITGTEQFYITDGGDVVIVFDEYAVAPGFMGACEFNVGKVK